MSRPQRAQDQHRPTSVLDTELRSGRRPADQLVGRYRTISTPSIREIASITDCGTSLSTSTSVYARSRRDLLVIVAMFSPAWAISCEIPPTMFGTLALAMA